MRANILSIAPGLPFLKTLAEAIIDGRILRGKTGGGDTLGSATPGDDPLALVDLTVFVPTRRAARQLAAEFTRALGRRSAILPAIRLLGEADESALFEALPADGLAATIDPLERRLLVARFVRQWKAGISAASLEVLAGESLVLPASAADALWLAGDLTALLDEAETEGAVLAGLPGLAPEDLARWWQLTLRFLDILTEHWPAVLSERGLVDPARARNEGLRREAERFGPQYEGGPVIVAGSTATSPATLSLMRAIATLPNGALVLPGLDRHLDDRSFDAVALPPSVAAAQSPASGRPAPGHAQDGLKAILSGLLVPREAVDHIAPPEETPQAAREAFISDALRPASTTDAWGDARGAGGTRHPPMALDGLALVEASDEREEALAIAVAMRDALDRPEATVALATPDRSLARRVVAELRRFGIEANDSAGRALGATPPGTLLTLAAEVAMRPGDPIAIVGLLKHPLLRLGMKPGEARRGARAIETVALRGTVGFPDAASLAGLFAACRAANAQTPHRMSRPVRLIPDEDLDLAALLSERLEAALLPLTRLRNAAPADLPVFGRAVTEALEALATDAEGAASELYREEAGTALAAFLSRLVACPRTGFDIAALELPDVLAALMATETVRPRGGLSAHVFVWGALEARLQSVDTMVLGGLNEGTWPQRTSSDSFLSRPMRAALGLAAPERRIGLAAHDVSMALGHRRVVMTRSQRAGGAPQVASRWLQRLTTLAGPQGCARLRAEGAVFLHHARRLDAATEAPRAARPAPRPPLEARPRRYSVTEIETLIRDPYAVHARRILRLEPMPEMIRSPGAADRGSLFHDVLAAFVTEAIDPMAGDAEAQLLGIARDLFAAEALPAEIEAIWWPRMETLAANYIDWERERCSRVAKRFAETRGEIRLAVLDTQLTGFADRIDLMTDGGIEIIDFKTGTQPSIRQARQLLAPQLPLEGAMARRGGFPVTEGPARSVSDLLYVRLRERALVPESLADTDRKAGADITGDSLSDAADAKLNALLAAYLQEDRAFLSRPRPFLAGDFSGAYDHLARAREWSVGADETEGSE